MRTSKIGEIKKYQLSKLRVARKPVLTSATSYRKKINAAAILEKQSDVGQMEELVLENRLETGKHSLNR